MKNVLWLMVGAGAGFVAAHFVSRSPRGKQFFDDVDARARQFGEAVAEGYKQREAELRSTVVETQSDVEDAIADLSERAK